MNAEQFWQLRGGNDKRCGIAESVHHRMGDKIDDQSQSQHSEAELENADQHCQQNGIRDVLLTTGCRQRLETRSG